MKQLAIRSETGYLGDNNQFLMRQIIARHITNLTDARYFAAWYIDFIAFNIDPQSPFFISADRIEEINSWIEGHKILLEGVDGARSDLPDHHGVIHNNSIYLKNNSHSNRASGIILNRDEYTQNMAHEDKMIFIDFQNQEFDLDFLARHPDIGLVVHGGSEEKVGLKSFEQLDDLHNFLNP